MRIEDKMFEYSPAQEWQDCYPLGNGNLGVMEYGKLNNNVIHFNDDKLWSGNGKNKTKRCDSSVLDNIRNLISKKHYAKAEHLVCDNILSEFTETYLPLCRLNIATNLPNHYDKYIRQLNLSNATHTVNAIINDKIYSHNSFVSFPDRIYVGKYSCDFPFDMTLSLDTDMPCKHLSDSLLNGHGLAITGNAPSKHEFKDKDIVPITEYSDDNRGMEFFCEVFIESDGVVSSNNNFIEIKNAKNILIYFAQEVEFHPKIILANIVKTKIIKALGLGYNKLLKHHVDDHNELYGRVGLFLQLARVDELPVSDMLANRDEYIGRLITLLFNFGRYLSIASSRSSTEAANLQGIWNKDFYPSWNSNYTLNINTEMNYWSQDICNLSECIEPLFSLIDKISITGKITARNTFGCAGWVVGHNSDYWGHSSHVGTSDTIYCRYAMYMTASGWLCRHIYEHYLFSKDEDFMRKNYKYLISAAEFYIDFLTYDKKKGIYVCSPSSSPENSYMRIGRHALTECSTMDMAIIRELFHNILIIADQFIIDNDTITKIREILPLLPAYSIKHGRIAEWSPNHREAESKHRHLSHLYGLYPGNEITIHDTPKLAQAAYNSLKRRGSGGPSWSIVWKSLLYSRLHLGNQALNMLNTLLTPIALAKSGNGGVSNSLLSLHPPFQIDGNLGSTAAICEMLIQSHYKNTIELLPALPDALSEGMAVGLIGRGGYTISMKWKNCSVYELYIKHDFNHNAKIIINGKQMSLPTNKFHTL